jgi:hypothetical protein
MYLLMKVGDSMGKRLVILDRLQDLLMTNKAEAGDIYAALASAGCIVTINGEEFELVDADYMRSVVPVNAKKGLVGMNEARIEAMRFVAPEPVEGSMGEIIKLKALIEERDAAIAEANAAIAEANDAIVAMKAEAAQAEAKQASSDKESG